MKKTVVIEALNSLDDNFDAERLIERILFVDKVEEGMNDVKEGKVLDYKDVKEKFYNKWNK